MARHRVKGYSYRKGGRTIRVKGHMARNPRGGRRRRR